MGLVLGKSYKVKTIEQLKNCGGHTRYYNDGSINTIGFSGEVSFYVPAMKEFCGNIYKYEGISNKITIKSMWEGSMETWSFAEWMLEEHNPRASLRKTIRSLRL